MPKASRLTREEENITRAEAVRDSSYNCYQFLVLCYKDMAYEVAQRPEGGPSRLVEACAIGARHTVNANLLSAAVAQRLVSQATGAPLDHNGNLPQYTGELWLNR